MPVPDLAATLPATAVVLADSRRAGRHLGGQLYVSIDGRARVDAGFGEARPGEPMTRDHLLPWMSAGKPVTAVAIGRYWERGRLGLDEPVARHLPEFAAAGKERITVRHLLTHTGGIRQLDVGWPERSWDEIVAAICASRPEPGWEPGRRAGYHRAASWFVLGEILCRLAESDFATLVREDVFEPAGLGDSWIGMPADRFRAYGPRLAPLFATEGEAPREIGWNDEPRVTRPSPGAGARGPIRELGRFYERLLTGGAPWVGPPTVEALTARHRVGLVDRTFRQVLDWGLGFIPNSAYHGHPRVAYGYGPHASTRVFGHSGYRSSVAFADPEHGLAVALALNGLASDEEHRARIHAVTGAIYEDLGLATAG